MKGRLLRGKSFFAGPRLRLRSNQCRSQTLALRNPSSSRPLGRPAFHNRASHNRASHACRKLVSDISSSPDWELIISLNCCALMFSVRSRYRTSPGSRSNGRVLIGTPAAGVKNMLVSLLICRHAPPPCLFSIRGSTSITDIHLVTDGAPRSLEWCGEGLHWHGCVNPIRNC